jgi:histidinol phosphatase-like enzyme (inositol monophosphatase family)
MERSELRAYAEFALDCARVAGEVILPHFRAPIAVEDKGEGGDFDPVTIADRAAETSIRDAIARTYPTHGILGEEHGRETGSSALTWVLDPIDGTRSFIVGQLHWAILIALNDGTRPVVGVVHQPYVGESFVACAGDGAHWLRGEASRLVRTRSCSRIEDAIVITTDPRHFDPSPKAAVYDAVTRGARFIRFGGDCYCYTQLAMGLADVVIETGLEPYDIQALIPLVEAAGGAITNWTGGSCADGGDVLACGDPRLHETLLGKIAAAQ